MFMSNSISYQVIMKEIICTLSDLRGEVRERQMIIFWYYQVIMREIIFSIEI